jgi:hypothetical protein
MKQLLGASVVVVFGSLLAFALSGGPADAPADGGAATPWPSPTRLPGEFVAAPPKLEPIKPFLPAAPLTPFRPPEVVESEVNLPRTTVAEVSLPPPPKADEPRPVERFAGLPIDSSKDVDFLADAAVLPREGVELEDGLRDALALTVLAEARPTAEQAAFARRSLDRQGPWRSFPLGEGELAALVPAGTGADRKAHLARAADEYRRRRGDRPRTLLVFEYSFRPRQLVGSLTRRADVDGAALFTREYGFVEEEVRTEEGLKRFLSKVDDVVHVRRPAGDGGRYTFAGRRLAGRSASGLAPDEVLGGWLAERKAADLWGNFNTASQEAIDKFERDGRRQREDFQDRWEREAQRLRDGYASDDKVRQFERDAAEAARALTDRMEEQAELLRRAQAAATKKVAAEAEKVWDDLPTGTRAKWARAAGPDGDEE